MPASSSSSTNCAAIAGESLDGFRTTVLPVTIAAAVMPAMIAQREVPRRDDRADAERDVEQLVRSRRASA